MAQLDKVSGFSEFLDDSIIVFGDRIKNKRPTSSEMLNTVMLERINEVLSYLSSDLSCHGVFSGVSADPSDWDMGIPCEVLKPGQLWKSGKMTFRIVTEFVPDDIESENLPDKAIEPSLDTFR